MGLRYIPMTEKDKDEMLRAIGVESTEELFSEIPKEIRFKGDYNLPPVTSEYELKKELTKLANENLHLQEATSFLGAGVYEHFIPSVVNHVISRSEFYTAYTPYQPEISQGELQAIFEFQTMITELTGMDLANSSLYDGGTALGEAINLSYGHTKRKKILVSAAIHPEYRQVMETYGSGFDLQFVEIPYKDGVTDIEALKQLIDEDTASVVVQYPNFFGQIEPLAEINKVIKQVPKTLFITSSNPLALAYLTPPGEFGADIVVGDTQVFGIPAQLGGPHCGYFATTKQFMRKVPGRLVGQTTDENGVRGFVLTLQAREQHIRRDKATSNICSNQALFALASSVAMTALGKHGAHEQAYLNMQKARYLMNELEKNDFTITFKGPFFNEFVVDVKKPVSEVNKALLEHNIIGGYDLSKYYSDLNTHMLVAVTEVRTKEEIDQFVKTLKEVV
jgi:glycine dehydrogenase subunit 1